MVSFHHWYQWLERAITVEKLSTRQLRDGLAEILNRVAYGGDAVSIHRRGHPLAVLIPDADFEAFREWEDARDATAHLTALEEGRTADAMPLEDFIREVRAEREAGATP